MMVWPDGGTGMYHKHPFIGKCKWCPARSQLAQWVVFILVWGLFFSPVILYFLFHGRKP